MSKRKSKKPVPKQTSPEVNDVLRGRKGGPMRFQWEKRAAQRERREMAESYED